MYLASNNLREINFKSKTASDIQLLEVKTLIDKLVEIVSFVFPRISMFPETKSRETLRFEGKQN